MQKAWKWLSIAAFFGVLLHAAVGAAVPAASHPGPALAIAGAAEAFALILLAGIRRRLPGRRDALIYASLTALFIWPQAILTALERRLDLPPALLALSSCFSALASACALLLMTTLWRLPSPLQPTSARTTAAPPPADRQGAAVAAARKGIPVSTGFRNLALATTGFALVVAYLGACVSHTDYTGANCHGWPLCSRQALSLLEDAPGLVLVQLLASMALFGLVALLAHFGYHRYKASASLRRGSVAAVILAALQAASGALLVYDADLPISRAAAAGLHLAVISCLFGILCFLSIEVHLLRKGRTNH